MAQTATQQIELVTGWNAVWLEVEPPVGSRLPVDPTIAFDTATNTAITIIASPKPLAGFAELFGDAPGPENETFNQDSWEQWKRTPVASTNNLVSVTGNRGYLIKSTANLTLSVEGKARFFRPEWIPDRYNLVGFGLEGTPTFASFFDPAGDPHTPDKIYRLKTDGEWVTATTPPTQPMKSGEAYWIFADGPSNYMGPVAVDFDGASTGVLHFGGPEDAVPVGASLHLDLEEVVFTNLGTTDVTPGLDEDTPDPGSGSLDLSAVRPIATALNAYELVATITGSGTDLQETVMAGSSTFLTLGADRNWTSTPVGRTNVYRLRTGAGSEFYLPVTAVKSSIPQAPDTNPLSPADSLAGLWVGEINVNGVSSIVEDGAPVRTSAGSAPLRILLHSNDTGAVSLVSQVTVMQTKSADPSVTPRQVLVVDQDRIPFFEGIKERNGKRVGLRLESVAFDMPRSTEGGENYDLTLALNGVLGAGKTAETHPSTLVLDPTHRSNPFRHAYHRDHTKGPTIIREFSIVFDAEQPITDRLRGSYRETIQGLTKADLELTGSIILRRVSAVARFDDAQ